MGYNPKNTSIMFDEEFYPTPLDVIKKMIAPFKSKRGYYDFSDRIILEPSSGKGDIVDYLTGKYVVNQEERYGNIHNEYSDELVDIGSIYCIEQDQNLRHILLDKGYRVISDDFLRYSGDYFFNLILMNPPFSNGDQHLLKAWNTLDSGDIVCLLNSETIQNPFSKRRKLILNLIDQYGSVEHIGNVFSTAERKTDVEVSIVRLHKPEKKSIFDFQFDSSEAEQNFDLDESILNNAPAIKDIIGNMLIQYEKIKEAYVEYVKLADLLNHYGKPLVAKKSKTKERGLPNVGMNIFSIASSSYTEGNNKKHGYNIFCEKIKKSMWHIVVDNLNNIASFDIKKYMTYDVKSKFIEFIEKESHMDFTRDNVWSLITMLHANKNTIMDQCIEQLFDEFTKYYKENRHYVEGWKTNDKWKVNRKIILPNAVRYGQHLNSYKLKDWGDEFQTAFDSIYYDIDKIMDYITGGRNEGELGLFESLDLHFKELGRIRTGDKFENTGESAYFKWKFFKKGTLHIEFKDEYLWQEFNIRACKGKNWLPENEYQEYQSKKKELALIG